MRILYVIDTLNRGGKERRLVELLKKISCFKNIEILLVLLSEEVEYREVFQLPISIKMVEKNYGLDVSVFRKIWQIARQFRPHIIHTWGKEQALYASLATILLKLKLINGMVVDAPAKISRFSKKWRYKAMTFPFSTYVIANSYAGFKTYKLGRQKGRVIHNGYDMTRQQKIENCDVIKREYGIHNEKIVGMVANLRPLKDYHTYIRAANLVLDKNKDVKFFCVGKDNGQKHNIEKEIAPHHRGNIIFTGKVSDVESLINIFDICVLSTYTEGISNAIMEYMAAEKAVIATEGGGTNELVLEGETGYLIPAKDPQTMAERISYLLENPKIAAQMGKDGKKRIENQFNLEKMTEAYYQLYLSIHPN